MVVRATKFGLPIVIGGLVVLLAIAPFDKRGDVSFILDKNKVDEAQERMRVEQARYVGEDNKGQKFEIVADRAVQPTSNVPIVTIEGMRAQLSLAQGPAQHRRACGAATIWSRSGSRSTGRSVSPGPADTGWRRATSRSTSTSAAMAIERAGQRVDGAWRVPGGADSAPTSTSERSAWIDGVRLKIYQGAVR